MMMMMVMMKSTGPSSGQNCAAQHAESEDSEGITHNLRLLTG